MYLDGSSLGSFEAKTHLPALLERVALRPPYGAGARICEKSTRAAIAGVG
jgi:hypothetical protein